MDNLSTVYNHEGDQEQEMNCYDRALELDSSRPQIWHNRGYLYRQKGMFKDAILDYQESLRLRPQHIQTLLYKAIAHFLLEEFDDADKCLDEILEIDPNNTDALGNKANVMSKRGKFDDALKYIDRSLRINNKSIETWKNKAELLRWLGDSEGAKKSDEEADRLESNL